MDVPCGTLVVHNAHLIAIEGESYRKRKVIKKNRQERN
jgi:hypothetical protein